LQNIVENTPHNAFWKDRDSRYLGKTDFETNVSREEAEYFRRKDREVMESAIPELNFEELVSRADGTHVLLTSKVPLRDDAGSVVGILGMSVDITDRKRMERELQVAKAAAEDATRCSRRSL
jgi:PAS domain S-box-containing protein